VCLKIKYWGEELEIREEVTGDWRNLHSEELHKCINWIIIK
jgi:hypothetical protein